MSGPVHHMDIDDAFVVGRIVATLRIGSKVANLRTPARARRRYETPILFGELSFK
jgi:hypothetical protein